MITAFKVYAIIGELFLLLLAYEPSRMIVRADKQVGRLGTVVVCLIFPFLWLPALIASRVFGIKDIK